MTDEILKKAKENRDEYEDCKRMLSVLTKSAEHDIRIGCYTGSFSLAPELKKSFVQMMTDYLNGEMILLNEEYERL